jgi:hypothetical protein
MERMWNTGTLIHNVGILGKTARHFLINLKIYLSFVSAISALVFAQKK